MREYTILMSLRAGVLARAVVEAASIREALGRAARLAGVQIPEYRAVRVGARVN